MKKFVGYVNGVSFDNEKDFNKAAQEAIESGDDNLSISSYYKYSSDDEDDEDEENDPNFVSLSECFIGTRKPDTVTVDSVEYKVPEQLKKRLADASNKENIKKSLTYHINKLEDSIARDDERIKKVQQSIDDYQKRLYDLNADVNDLRGRLSYYNNIFSIVDEKQDEKTVEKKKDVKSILGIDGNTTLHDFLKQLGILN